MSRSLPPDQRDEPLRGVLSHINTSPLLRNLAAVVRAEALAEYREEEKKTKKKTVGRCSPTLVV